MTNDPTITQLSQKYHFSCQYNSPQNTYMYGSIPITIRVDYIIKPNKEKNELGRVSVFFLNASTLRYCEQNKTCPLKTKRPKEC